MVSPHCVVILSEATAGRNSVTKAPRRLASTRTIAEARGKMLAGSSRQYQGAGQCGDKIGDSGEKSVSGGFNRNARVQTSLRPPESAPPHRCALVRSSASAQHVPSRPDCIPRTFRDRAIRCCRFWVSHPKYGLSRRATHSCSLRALFASHHPPLRPPLWTHAPIVISACDALQMRQYASLRSAMSVR